MDIRLTMKKVDYLIYNVFISKYVMICETEVVYKNLLTDNLKFILQWKNDFPISQISIIDETLSIVLYCCMRRLDCIQHKPRC